MKQAIRKTRGWWKKVKLKILILELAVIGTSIGVIVVGVFVLWVVNLKLPDFSAFEERQIAQSTKIYDRTGEVLLNSVQSGVRRTVVDKGEINRHAKNAIVAIEDKIFYEHNGVRFTSMIRAFMANVRGGGKVQGASTITQQVVKNTLLTQDKLLSRKLKEIILAIKLERAMSKDDILALYLNEAPYGGEIYGIEEASQSFFAKSAKDLTLAESAYLAALPNAPTRYSPYGDSVDQLEARKDLVIRRMASLGFITNSEAIEALKEEVTFQPQENRGIKAPHFVFFVREYLEKKYGRGAVETGGLRVITTLDWEAQQKAEEVAAQYKERNEESFNAKNLGVVGLDPTTGQILVMIGSRDYFETENDGNFNVTLAKRQPGSSFKPFVYATAFKEGYTPDTVVFDVRTEFQSDCDPLGVTLPKSEVEEGCYQPVNYDDVYVGPITLRNALAQSRNVPAVKTLYLAGMRDSLNTARDMGIESLASEKRYGLTLVLGGGEVSLLELTNAYSTLANDGVYQPHTGILRIEGQDGQVLEDYSARGTKVLDENVARIVSDILSDNNARAPAYGYNSPLHFNDRDVATKTGTTNDFRDLWVIGYSPNLALGAWVGNNDNSPTQKKVAGLVVSPMWRQIFDAVIEGKPSPSFGRPAREDSDLKPVLRGIWKGNEAYVIDTVSLKLATEHTPEDVKEEKVVGELHSILHWLSKNNPRGPTPSDPSTDSQYRHWEFPVQLWGASNGMLGTGQIPTEYDDVHKPEYAPRVSFALPTSGASIPHRTPSLLAIAAQQSQFPIDEVEYFLNGVFFTKTSTTPFSASVVPSVAGASPGPATLKAIVYDTKRNRTEITTEVNITQ